MPTNNHSDNLFDSQAPLDDEQLWDLLSLYVDGEADPAQAAIVEQMLSSDPAYRRDFDFLMESSKTMQMVAEVAPPIGLRTLCDGRRRFRGRPARRSALPAASGLKFQSWNEPAHCGSRYHSRESRSGYKYTASQASGFRLHDDRGQTAPDSQRDFSSGTGRQHAAGEAAQRPEPF